uniref:Prostaglandin E2 receptor EP3 subtype n=1 Tax=Pygocentrus nattereri TaxID=42514 RepID=A0AAR2JVE8_PYGNA
MTSRCKPAFPPNISTEAMWESNVSKAARDGRTNSSAGCGSVSVAFPITMMLTGMVGNSLENKRKQSFLLCVGSLALTDLFGQVADQSHSHLRVQSGAAVGSGDPSRTLCAFFGVCMTTFGLCSLFMASAMAIERALAITAPHWYSNNMRTNVTKQVLVTVWCLVLLFALLPIRRCGRVHPAVAGHLVLHQHGGQRFGQHVFRHYVRRLGHVLAARHFLLQRGHHPRAGCAVQSQTQRVATVIQLLGIMCVLLICWSPLLVCTSVPTLTDLTVIQHHRDQLLLLRFMSPQLADYSVYTPKLVVLQRFFSKGYGPI